MSKLHEANPADYDMYGRQRIQLFVFTFGTYGDFKVLVWEECMEDALEVAADYLKTNGYLGLFTEPDYADAAKELGLDWTPESEESPPQEVVEFAEADLTYTESGFIASWEWWVRDASPELTKAYRRRCERLEAESL